MFLSGFLRSGFLQKPTLNPASIKQEVRFLSGFSKVGFVENYGLRSNRKFSIRMIFMKRILELDSVTTILAYFMIFL